MYSFSMRTFGTLRTHTMALVPPPAAAALAALSTEALAALLSAVPCAICPGPGGVA